MKKILLISLIVAVLFVFGCGEQGTEVPETTEPFIGGNGGIKMSFIEGAPPQYIFDKSGYEFGIAVQIENLGEAEVKKEDAYVVITGMNPTDLGTTGANLKKNLPIDLRAARKNFEGTELPGGTTAVEFSSLKYVPDLHGNTVAKIRADLCYKYNTMTSTKICIKKDVLSELEEARICNLAGEKEPKNSGAPVHITSLKEAPMGEGKIQLTFIVEHVGSPLDAIFKKGSECHDVVTNRDKNKVYLDVTSDVDGIYPKCTGLEEPTSDHAGYITLFDDAQGNPTPRTVTCSLDITHVQGDFEELFEVNLEYNYLQFIEKPLEIRDVSTGSS